MEMSTILTILTCYSTLIRIWELTLSLIHSSLLRQITSQEPSQESWPAGSHRDVDLDGICRIVLRMLKHMQARLLAMSKCKAEGFAHNNQALFESAMPDLGTERERLVKGDREDSVGKRIEGIAKLLYGKDIVLQLTIVCSVENYCVDIDIMSDRDSLDSVSGEESDGVEDAGAIAMWFGIHEGTRIDVLDAGYCHALEGYYNENPYAPNFCRKSGVLLGGSVAFALRNSGFCSRFRQYSPPELQLVKFHKLYNEYKEQRRQIETPNRKPSPIEIVNPAGENLGWKDGRAPPSDEKYRSGEGLVVPDGDEEGIEGEEENDVLDHNQDDEATHTDEESDVMAGSEDEVDLRRIPFSDSEEEVEESHGRK
ncbi:hypothetical protein G7Y89_g6811 [Cudoniella acicularis]|uniref:Uncharacterized protein n=1 Tax=Cudoniella acicularis TaxID=354080 RepID=A0A8H4W2P1_9HELO|nr:hypothetical protein G7Y89_g6811 [Cudoniella acicularis]